ncbi:MAG: hypothetical protein CML43_00625 [Rhodobacteraceae bacterium]|nr:hypothetical protein [Paracoccaceae bacterium]
MPPFREKRRIYLSTLAAAVLLPSLLLLFLLRVCIMRAAACIAVLLAACACASASTPILGPHNPEGYSAKVRTVEEVIAEAEGRTAPAVPDFPMELLIPDAEDEDVAKVDELLRQRRAVLGDVPAQFSAGDTLPANTLEQDAVGELRQRIQPNSPEFDLLVENTDPDINFEEDILFGERKGDTKRMTSRLEAVLRRMADEVKNFELEDGSKPFRLSVYRAYRYPVENDDSNDLHYEGRAAWVSILNTNSGSAAPTSGRAQILMRSAWGVLWNAPATRHLADWVRLNPSNYVQLSVTPDACGATLDLAFLLDGSGSVNNADNLWEKQLDFVREVTEHFTLASDDTRVGIVTFHGPRLSHYSYVDDRHCPQGTIFGPVTEIIAGEERTSYVCSCFNSGSICTDDGADVCRTGNYAKTEGACDNGIDGSPDCELRHFFPLECQDCTCIPLGPKYGPTDSYTVNMQFDAAQADPALTRDAVSTLLDQMKQDFPDGATHMSAGLERMYNQIFKTGTGMRPFDASVPRVLITLTDGKSTPGWEPEEFATKLKDVGITLFSVGLGEFYQPEVEDLASEPIQRHAYSLSNANAIYNIIDRMTYETCELAANLEAATQVTVTVPTNTYRYFQGVCDGSALALTSNVIVEATTPAGQGRVALYVSSKSTHTNPGPLRNEQMAGFDEPEKQIFHSRVEDGVAGPLYMAVHGSPSDVSSSASLIFYLSVFKEFERTISVPEGSGGVAFGGAPEMEEVEGFTPSYTFSRDATIDGEGLFSVNSQTGVITVSGTLDREVKAQYTLKLWAQDANNACYKGYQLITINVDDVNDNKPVFDQTLYEVSVDEAPREPASPPDRRRRAVGDALVTVSASDPDGGDVAITYRITAGNDAGFFALDADTGVLTQEAEIDFEAVTGGVIELSVVANDGVEDSAPATIRVTVGDLDDPPFFAGLSAAHRAPTALELSTGSLVGVVPGFFDVTDDATLNNFTCVLQAPATLSSVLTAETRIVPGGDRQCRVKTTDSLAGKDGEYPDVLLLLQDDSGNTYDYALFNLVISASNDNEPVFSRASYTVRMSRVEPVGSVIFVGNVSDADGDRVTCSIYSGPVASQYLEVAEDAEGGNRCTFKLAKAYDDSRAFFNMVVRASDTEKDAFASVQVVVYDGCPVTEDCVEGTACAEGLESTCECANADTVPGQACDDDSGEGGNDDDGDDVGIDYCKAAGMPCRNGATCVNVQTADTYRCDMCPIFIQGKDCDQVQDKCSPSPCENNGTCTRIHVEKHGSKPLRDGPDFDDAVLNSFECACPETHYGERCQLPDPSDDFCDTADPDLCNDGTCVRASSVPDGPKDTYVCDCPANTFGDHCERSRDDCDASQTCAGTAEDEDCAGDCQNGGVCEATAAGGDCLCTDAFYGATCGEPDDDTEDACGSSPCRNGGTCVRIPSERNGPKDDFRCECPAGFGGDTCAQTSEECDDPTFCKNGGTCVPSTNGGACQCPASPIAGRCYKDRTCAVLVSCDDLTLGSTGDDGASAGVGIIAGVVVGVLLVLILVLLVLYRRRKNKPAPVYDVDTSGSNFSNPTFMAVNKGADEGGPDAMSNPFYGVNAAMQEDTYGSAQAGGNYDTVGGAGADTYDTVGGGAGGMAANRNVRVENGRMRLASVSRANPLQQAGESSTDDVDGFNNPMYAAGANGGPALPGMSNPGYSSTYGDRPSVGGVSNPGYRMNAGGGKGGYDQARAGGSNGVYDQARAGGSNGVYDQARTGGNGMPNDSYMAVDTASSRGGRAGGYDSASRGGNGGYDSAASRDPAYDVGGAPGDESYMTVSNPGGTYDTAHAPANGVHDSYMAVETGRGNGGDDTYGGFSGYDAASRPSDPAYDTAHAAGNDTYFTPSGQNAGASSGGYGYDTASNVRANDPAYDTAATGHNSEGQYDYATRR